MSAGGDALAGGTVQLESVFLVIVQGGCFGLLLGLLFGLLGNVQDLANFDIIRVGDFGVCSLELLDCDVELMGNGGQAVASNNGVVHGFLGKMGRLEDWKIGILEYLRQVFDE